MKYKFPTLQYKLPFVFALLATPISGFAGDKLIPAGSIIQCTISEPKISSKTEQMGDPVLCQVSHVELYGRSVIPFGSYLVGRFEDYKDPGHFVGKGWVELRFDRLVIQPDVTVPLDARVVSVPKYPVDAEGKIHGTGHAVKDTIDWFIPVLWPLDLINLPRRGPRVVLKPETRLTLKVMDDVGISYPQLEEQDPDHRSELLARHPAPIVQNYNPQPQQQSYAPAPIVQSYAPQPPQTIIYNNYPAAQQQPPQQQQQVVVMQQPPVQQYIRPVMPMYAYPPSPYYGYYARPPLR